MKLRLFLTCWIVFSLHFATNVVREHYPAFALIEHGSFQLDEYAGLHADIFEHTDGHHYVGNQVAGAVIAAIPLFLFDPLLDALEDYRVQQLANGVAVAKDYETEYPRRREFYRKVVARGLDLRFGAATAVTSVFLMAPLSAGLAVLMFVLLMRRGVPERRSLWLALLFAFGTPIFYRTASLNHNMFVMAAAFVAFTLLWPRQGVPLSLSRKRAGGAGVLAGTCLALDYAGVILLLCLFGYLLVTHARAGGLAMARRAGVAFVLGTLPPVGFLLWTQYWMYGDPFLPGQFWMPHQNEYVGEGVRGFTAPDPELVYLNLLAPSYGLFVFGPLLLLVLVPTRIWRSANLILPVRERVFVAVLAVVFTLFCSSNQYARLQWNTGFRYLLPLVPFLFLAVCDHLAPLPAAWLVVVSVPVVAHSWVMSMTRYLVEGGGPIVGESWQRVFTEGVQFPWLQVLRTTGALPYPWLASPFLPYGVLGAAAVAIALIWACGRRQPPSEPAPESGS